MRDPRGPWLLWHPDDLVEVAQEYGFLPFFNTPFAGWSVAEHTPPELWFVKDVEGPWEWKDGVVADGRCAYAKLLGDHLTFVARAWLPRLLVVARSRHVLGYEEERVLAAVTGSESLLSTEIAEQLGYRSTRVPMRQGGHSLDWLIGRLQMSGRLVVSGVEYRHTRAGRRYGWGVCRYATPEALYADWLEMPDLTPQQAADDIVRQLQKVLPQASLDKIRRFVRGPKG